MLRGWQERVLAAVQSTQLDSAAVLPLLLVDDTSSALVPRSTPFSDRHQKDCRFDGRLEDDVRDPEKRRPLVATENLFVDHHVREHLEGLPEGITPKKEFTLSLTGAQVSRLPRYRLLGPMTQRIPSTDEERREEARQWAAAYAEDYRLSIAVGQMHEHKSTCFKYVLQQGLRTAKHCRFLFNHFVKKAEQVVVDGVIKVRDVVRSRTGKDPVLPRLPGEPAPDPAQIDEETGEPLAIRPTTKLGPTVVIDDARGMAGRTPPVRYNPLEGSSNGPSQVSIRGNLDYRDMRRTFKDGFSQETSYATRP